jgi:hypothetical protein
MASCLYINLTKHLFPSFNPRTGKEFILRANSIASAPPKPCNISRASVSSNPEPSCLEITSVLLTLAGSQRIRRPVESTTAFLPSRSAVFAASSVLFGQSYIRILLIGTNHLKLAKTVGVPLAIPSNLYMNGTKTGEMCFEVFHKLFVGLACSETASLLALDEVASG